MIRQKKFLKQILFIVITLSLYSCSSTQIAENYIPKDVVEKYSPLKDDELAKKYAPVLESGSPYGDPFGLYYRASRDSAGNTHVAYHYLWEKEENTGDGVGAFFSRNIYTGGLKFQKIIFGKGDVEVISFIIDASGEIRQVEYETAENYDSSKFSVIHLHAIRKGPHKSPLLFKVISWNHLFEYIKDNAENNNVIRLTPAYFSEKLWREYEMVKESESFFSRNRAHRDYEKEFAE